MQEDPNLEKGQQHTRDILGKMERWVSALNISAVFSKTQATLDNTTVILFKSTAFEHTHTG